MHAAGRCTDREVGARWRAGARGGLAGSLRLGPRGRGRRPSRRRGKDGGRRHAAGRDITVGAPAPVPEHDPGPARGAVVHVDIFVVIVLVVVVVVLGVEAVVIVAATFKPLRAVLGLEPECPLEEAHALLYEVVVQLPVEGPVRPQVIEAGLAFWAALLALRPPQDARDAVRVLAALDEGCVLQGNIIQAYAAHRIRDGCCEAVVQGEDAIAAGGIISVAITGVGLHGALALVGGSFIGLSSIDDEREDVPDQRNHDRVGLSRVVAGAHDLMSRGSRKGCTKG
mmetsp:Transcript_62750/g.198713  ORF Transcript_62750/g.198713 Transcript_62750/m.198713 type:complete len:283 (-) Transcript_62750:144-992(-)